MISTRVLELSRILLADLSRRMQSLNTPTDSRKSQPPPVLYKYFPPERLDVVKNGLIRFSQLASFNDPLESSPFMGVLPDEGPLQNVVDDIIRGREHVRPEDLLRAHGFSFANVIGTLSLSEDPLSLLMWAHYAYQHEGFVLGLDTNGDCFKPQGFAAFRDDNFGLEELRPVQYQMARPAPIDTIALAMGNDDAPFVKSPEWAYEKEWRIRRHKEFARTTLSPDSAFPVWLMDLPPRCVLEIILGCRMRQSLRKNLRDILRADKRYSHVRLYQAWPHPIEYSLRLLPLTIETLHLPQKRIVITDVPEDRVPEVIQHCARMATLYVERVIQPERGRWTIVATTIGG
jgi:Protein of unknown function (DUF2971)